MTDPIPGSARNSAPMTVRICGTIASKRNALMMRKARNTERGPAVGTHAIATITKSKMFQALRKKRPRYNQILRPISAVKNQSASVSSVSNRGPAVCIASGQVSRPSVTALIAMMIVTARLKVRDSTTFRNSVGPARAMAPALPINSS